MLLFLGLALLSVVALALALRRPPRELRLPREEALSDAASPETPSHIDLTAHEIGRDDHPRT